ncbi:amino acid ABC transporter ATP-binding protein [Pseudomonas sp. M47T1]|nr:amino acid ABC transporter ATP-binding protein [Pseudomonas sp. M47T1]
MLDFMKTLALEGMTMICVTHEMGFAREVAHPVLFFDHGKLLEDSAPEHLLRCFVHVGDTLHSASFLYC